jgi:hypothetical protein
MTFYIEQQYPNRWINTNQEEPPVLGCVWEAEAGDDRGYGAYKIEINSLEELQQLASNAARNVFIRFNDRVPFIVLTEQTEID